MRYLDAVERAEISYRQADYWRSRGYIQATAEGTGIPSEISSREASVLIRTAALARAGMKVADAAKTARWTIDHETSTIEFPTFRITFK